MQKDDVRHAHKEPVTMLGLKEFYKFNEQYNNTFESAMVLAKKARELAESTHYSVLDSKALTWALTGIKPEFTDMAEYKEFRKIQRTEDILNYVSDKRIVDSVNRSLNESKINKKLTYLYEDSLNHDERQRVDVLTNLIWYKAEL